jgi:hypothetical protein
MMGTIKSGNPKTNKRLKTNEREYSLQANICKVVLSRNFNLRRNPNKPSSSNKKSQQKHKAIQNSLTFPNKRESPKISFGNWKDITRCKDCLDRIKIQLGLQHWNDWYSVRNHQVIQLGGGGLLQYFGGSLSSSLTSIYPNHNWEPWKFHQIQRGLWKKEKEVQRFVVWLENQLEIKEISDWYRINRQVIRRVAPTTIMEYHGSLYAFLTKIYPQHNWDKEKLSKKMAAGNKASQRMLKLTVQRLFPNTGDVIFIW